MILIPDYQKGSRAMQKQIRGTLKNAWREAALYFHTELRERRFSKEHARKAGYAPRKGEESRISQKSFWRSYTGRKLKKFGHTLPLEFTGRTRAAMRAATITATSKGASIKYSGARVFNFHNPLSDPRMDLNREFRTILPEEANEMARIIEESMWTVNESTDAEVLQLLGF